MGSEINATIGRQLKKRRIELGLSQEALGNRLKVTFQQVQKYEKGTNNINADKLFQLTNILQVPVSYFFEQQSTHIETTEEIASERETLEVIKAFKTIKRPEVRKRMADLLRAINLSE